MSKKTKITYRLVGDYLIPNLILPPEETKVRLGKWGMMHKDYLEHNKRGYFMLMIAKGTLWTYLTDVDKQAREMYDTLVGQMKENEGVTEQLKAIDQMEWACRVENIEARAREVVCSDLIYK